MPGDERQVSTTLEAPHPTALRLARRGRSYCAARFAVADRDGLRRDGCLVAARTARVAAGLGPTGALSERCAPDLLLLDHVLLARGSTGGTLNAHNNYMLPTILAGGARIGIRHRGHVIVEGKSLGNLWRTMTELMGMPTPAGYFGGEHDGIVKELVTA